MKTYIIPALIKAKTTKESIESVANELGFTHDIVSACLAQCDLNSNLPFPISDLKLPRPENSNKTIKQIALETGVSERTVSRHLKAQGVSASSAPKPSISELFEHRTLADLAKFLKIDIERLKIILK